MRARTIHGLQRCAILGALHRAQERQGPAHLTSTALIARRLPWTLGEVRRQLEVMARETLVYRDQRLSRTDRWRLLPPVAVSPRSSRACSPPGISGESATKGAP